MCLDRKGSPIAKIAKGDITVYKKLKRVPEANKSFGPPFKRREFISVHFAFKYELGYHYINDNFPLENAPYSMTDQGMHSFDLNKIKHYKNRSSIFNRGYSIRLIECTIPKGTPYYRGTGGDIISRELILERVITKSRFLELCKLHGIK